MFGNKYIQHCIESLEQLLEKRVDELSQTTAFVRRKSKLTGRVFVQALVLSWLERPNGSLNEVSQSCAEMGVDISESGLQQRMTGSAVALLRGLFTEALAQLPKARQVPAEVLRHFNAVYMTDSTTLNLPNRLQGLFAGVGGKLLKSA